MHTQVDYIHCLVPDLHHITACGFYWGKMDRYEAERLLDGRQEGSFLLRDSAQVQTKTHLVIKVCSLSLKYSLLIKIKLRRASFSHWIWFSLLITKAQNPPALAIYETNIFLFRLLNYCLKPKSNLCSYRTSTCSL